MAYKPSPRPKFQGPTHIPFESTTLHLWGEEAGGQVPDWCYVSSEKIHQLIFGLPPGGAFRHSENYKTIFAADEVYYVLSGTLVLANPETGEVHLAEKGEAVFFRRDTWHHGFNYSNESLRVLEVLAPPPSSGSCGQYALEQPDLVTRKYTRDELLGDWPSAKSRSTHSDTMRIIRKADYLWGLEGEEQQVLVGILVSTEYLTVGRIDLLPARRSSTHEHQGDESIYVLAGSLHIYLPDHSGQRWFQLKPGDGFYLPEGTPHQYHNITDKPAEMVFAVSPNYKSRQ